MSRCEAICKTGRRCKKRTIIKDTCYIHLPELCSICLNKPKCYTVLSCSHIFCKDCIYRWIDHSDYCPNCRSEVTLFNIQESYGYLVSIGYYVEISNTIYSFNFSENEDLYYLVYDLGYFNKWISEAEFELFDLFCRLYNISFDSNVEIEYSLSFIRSSDYYLPIEQIGNRKYSNRILIKVI
jgi:hypothetical protein